MGLDYKTIGKRIRRFRMSKNITQEELAFQIGSSAAYICNIECGKKKASLDKLYEIAEILGITLNDLTYSSSEFRTASCSKELAELLSLCPVEDQKLLLGSISSIIRTLIT